MANLTQPATLADLKYTVENIKVYVDSDKTVSIKGHLKKNNTHCFYSTDNPTEDTTPVFSFDIAEELFLDQAQTKFVPNFVWSAETYTNSTNPNLDGKPVMVLAVKGDESVTYSFLNLEELVDTYTTKDTSSLSLSISEDGEISGDVKISEEEGNAVELKDDGLYVPTGGGEEPLIVEMRFDVGTPNCTITSLSETYQTIYEALRTNKEVVVKGYNNSARTDAPLWFYPIGYIANSNMATFQCVYNYSVNSITAYYLQITSVGNYLSYNQSDMTNPDLSEYVTYEELAEEIANASHLSREIITTIPTADTAKENVIYMLKVESANGSDVYQEYQLINDEVVLVGDTSVDLSGYQKSLVGTAGQFVGFNNAGNPVAQALPVDTAISSMSNNPISNRAVYYALADKQPNLNGMGTEGQFVSFSNEGEIIITEDLPVYVSATSSAYKDSRVEISSTSLVIKQHFRRAKITLTNTLPNTGSGNLGGRVVVELYRVADGTYKCFSTCSPVININSANVVTVYNFAASVHVSEQSDGSLKIISSAGGGMYGFNLQTGTTNLSGSGGAGGNFNDILVWF